MASLACVLMLCGYFPYFTYAVPAVSGLFIMIAFFEAGAVYSVFAYVASAVISLFLCEKEVAILYLLLFGYYPILKAYIERIKSRVAEWVIKLAVFNAAAVLSYLAASFVFGISYEDFGIFGKYGALIFLLICNGVFVLYDIAIARVGGVYSVKLHSRISKLLK